MPPASDEALAALPMRTAARVAGRRKAAVLMAALGSHRAAAGMPPPRGEEIETLSLEMVKMGPIDEETTEAILGELTAISADGLGGIAGGIELAREVLERALG